MLKGDDDSPSFNKKILNTKKISPHPAVAGLPNKDSGVRHWGLEPQTP